jgi:hypothetical protein
MPVVEWAAGVETSGKRKKKVLTAKSQRREERVLPEM